MSLGHTIGQNLAIGAGYEYADYGSLDSRYNTGIMALIMRKVRATR